MHFCIMPGYRYPHMVDNGAGDGVGFLRPVTERNRNRLEGENGAARQIDA